MKKLFNSMMAIAIAACTFTSCEDVPEPYNNPYSYTPAETIAPKGTGTQADPFNVAAALAKCQEVGEAGTTEDVYAEGYVVSIKSIDVAQYNNAEFSIADSKEGGDMLTVYRAKGPGNQPITDANIIKNGDKVLICGKLVNYKGNTPEFTQGCYIVSVNGEGGENGNNGGNGGNNDETIGTKENPKSVADALAAINALDNNATTSAFYYIKGKVKTVKTTDANITQYKNIDYTIVDEGQTAELTVFRGKYLNNADFTIENKVKEGDEVIVYGKLTKYEKDGKVTPEVAQGNYLVALNGGNGEQGGGGNNNGGATDVTGTGTVSGNTLTINATEFGFVPTSGTNCPATSTTLVDGTKIFFDKATGSTPPAFYNTSGFDAVRVYANNTIKIVASKNITKIEITTTDPSTDKYNGSDDAYAEANGSKVNVNKESDTKVSYAGLNASTVNIVNYNAQNSKNQLRIKQMVITFAE